VLRNQIKDVQVLRDLGDGLILRRALAADTEALATFNAEIHRDPTQGGPDWRAGIWTRDMMQGRVAGMTSRDFTIVEDSRRKMIVSSCCLIPQTWTYAGIPFGVGRPELVGTHPEYRNRGLVRVQFELMHRASAEQGHLMQGITGIPYYYRQFGYEMAVDLGGSQTGPRALVPKLPEGQAEPYRLRPAAEADLSLILRLAGQASGRSLLAAVRDAGLWRYEMHGRSPDNANGRIVRILETAGGDAVGLVVHFPVVWRNMMSAMLAEVLPGLSWLDAASSLLRYLAAYGQARTAAGDEPCEWVGLSLIEDHPLLRVAGDWLPRSNKPYGWYLRVPDLPAFLRLIRPVLEERLAASPAPGHTGVLKLSFYRSGLRLAFEGGRLAAIEPWQPEPEPGDTGDAGFSGLSFLQLLFGYRNLDELRHIFPDCWVHGVASRVLLEALFPRQPSAVWPID
jgi:hypothetical protein